MFGNVELYTTVADGGVLSIVHEQSDVSMLSTTESRGDGPRVGHDLLA